VWPFRVRKQDKTADKGGTPATELELRMEALEVRVRRLTDLQAELEDGIARRLDKYRKRIERDEAEPQGATVAPVERRPLALSQPRLVSLDELAVRRGNGPRTFPGGGK